MRGYYLWAGVASAALAGLCVLGSLYPAAVVCGLGSIGLWLEGLSEAVSRG